MCHVLAPASVNAPPSGRTPVGRLASNAVSPRGGAPMIAVPLDPMVGGPTTASWVSDAGAAVPVTV